jgi:hypothetical protein
VVPVDVVVEVNRVIVERRVDVAWMEKVVVVVVAPARNEDTVLTQVWEAVVVVNVTCFMVAVVVY